MLLDLRKLFASYDEPVKRSFSVDLSAEDFPGYTVKKPAEVSFTATLQGSAMELVMRITAQVQAECARCLAAIEREYVVDKTYFIRDEEWQADEPELPFTKDGKLDLKELAYTELVLEIPTVLLCSDDCAGLCPVCGNPKPCSCRCETNVAIDERLSILKQLLN